MTDSDPTTMTIPPTHDMLPVIQEFIREAIRYSCGNDMASFIDDYPVTYGNTWKTNGDFQCFVAAAIFSRTIGMQNKALAAQRSAEAAACGEDCSTTELKPKPKKIKKIKGGVMKVRTVSEFGLVRDREYTSARDVAEGIVSCFDCCNEETYDKIADVRISGKSACIVITTKAHMEWHIGEDRFPCSVCGKFCKSARGLRYHQVLEHDMQYHDAQKTAMDIELQVILYTHVGGSGATTYGNHVKADARSESVRARDKLGDEGLEYARAGDLAALQQLITSGWNAHVACDKHGNTALMWAAGEGHLHICEYLVDVCGVNVHEKKGGKYKKIRHALHWAARNGRIAVCDWLIHKKNIDVNIEADDGTVPFHFAVWTNNIPMVKWLVEVAHCDIHKLNSYGCNASQWGALNGDVDMLRLLQSYGLDLGLLNLNGHSAVHKAAVNGRLDACKWLLTGFKIAVNMEDNATQRVCDYCGDHQQSSDDNKGCCSCCGSGGGGGGLMFDIHMKADKSGNTPAMIALNNGHIDTSTWLDNYSKQFLDHGKEKDSEGNIASSNISPATQDTVAKLTDEFNGQDKSDYLD